MESLSPALVLNPGNTVHYFSTAHFWVVADHTGSAGGHFQGDQQHRDITVHISSLRDIPLQKALPGLWTALFPSSYLGTNQVG